MKRTIACIALGIAALATPAQAGPAGALHTAERIHGGLSSPVGMA